MSWIDPDDTPSNPHVDATETLPELIGRTVSRRSVLAGGAATAALTVFAGSSPAAAAEASSRSRGRGGGNGRSSSGHASLGFEPIQTGSAPAFGSYLLAEGYTAQILAPWGDPVDGSSPAYVDGGGNSAAEQELQIGMGHDGMEYFPIRGSSRRGLLAINHEYTIRTQLFPAELYDDPTSEDAEVAEHTEETVLKEQNAHGVSVVQVRKRGREWQVEGSHYARRITPNTEMDISGPAAGHELLVWGDRDGTTTDGTVNNCSSGQTPWGTYVTCEENFNGYFWVGGEAVSDDQQELFDRYGFSEFGFGYPWGGLDERWRADLNPGRTNTYGWNVEIDPFDPDAKPIKRTAMGRIKHEGATFTETRNGRVVCYMGDDERFDYLYKYVSRISWRSAMRRGDSPLDDGTLYVARFDEDGTGEWLAVDYDSQPALQDDPRFSNQAEVLIKTRMAADVLGATPCDRPEWTAVHPETGDVYVTMTNNSRRTAPDPANPIVAVDGEEVVGNEDGHIVTLRYHRGNNALTEFDWDIFLAGGDGSIPPSVPETDHFGLPWVSADAAFGSPDGLGFDWDGRLYIQTDGGQPYGMNDQMLVANTEDKDVRRIFMGPRNCEVTGLTFTPDGKTCFINIQHPNDEVPPANDDSAVFPDTTGDVRPRPSTIVITKDDGGVIGS